MNLLIDPVFRVETSVGRECHSLPELLQALGDDRVESLLGLQRHQEDAVHIFLCYLAGAVLAREGRTDPRQNAEFWLAGLRRLTGRDDDCAWMLVVEDVTRPAFMQAPAHQKADFAAFKPKAMTPVALDILPTAKNHDVKSTKSENAMPDAWVYALISLQTMSGFFGQGNYGIARMNGGFASRPMVALADTPRPGTRWRRDTAKLLAVRDELLAGPWRYSPEGLALMWTQPWDLKTSLSLTTLDPFFIELARAVRLVSDKGRIVAFGASSKAARVAANGDGVLGDPWTPINLNDKKKGQSALTVSSAGLTPELLRNLLFEEGYAPGKMQQIDAGQENRDCCFNATVLVRGQGTTDGFHHIALSVPGRAAGRLFRRNSERDKLARLSKTALNDAKEMQNRILKPALIALLEGGPDKINFDKREINAWLSAAVKQYSDAWAVDYFPWLWRIAEHADDDAARLQWLQALSVKAKTVFADALARYPSRQGRRYRSQVQAEALFYGSLYKTFPELKESRP